MKLSLSLLHVLRVSGLAAVAVFLVTGCGSTTNTTEDSSTSGTVASMVGGAYSSAGGAGALAMQESAKIERRGILEFFKSFSIADAIAATTCPTVGGSATGCNASGTTLTMTYSACSFGSATATWTGSQALLFSTGSPTCSAFPASFTGNLTRTFGASTVRTAASGTTVTINSGSTAAADGNTYGGGTIMAFNSGTRTGLTVGGINYVGATAAGAKLFNHSITTSPGGTPGAGITIASAVATGSVAVFHNLIKVTATSTLNNVTFTAGCCQPTSGSISTTFSAISGTAAAKSGFAGATETLTFTGCGTATYTGPEGYTGNVTLAHCL